MNSNSKSCWCSCFVSQACLLERPRMCRKPQSRLGEAHVKRKGFLSAERQLRAVFGWGCLVVPLRVYRQSQILAEADALPGNFHRGRPF